MKAAARSRRDRIRAQLADLKMPGALEAIDDVLTGVDGGGVTASEAIEQLLGAQITLRNNRRLQAAMRSSRLPGIKTLDDFDFSFQPSIPLDNRLARATGSRQRGFLISPIPRESEATEGRGRQEIPELLRTQRKVEVRFSDVRDLPGFPPGFSNRGSCGGGC